MIPVIMPGMKAFLNFTLVLGMKRKRPVIISPDRM